MKNNVANCIYDYLTSNNIELDKSAIDAISSSRNPTTLLVSIFKDKCFCTDTEIVDQVSIYKWLLYEFARITANEWEPSNIEIIDNDEDERCGFDEIFIKFNSFGKPFEWLIGEIDSDYISPDFYDRLFDFADKNLNGRYKLLETFDQTIAVIYVQKKTMDVIEEMFTSKEMAQALCSAGNSEYLCYLFDEIDDSPEEICAHFNTQLEVAINNPVEDVLDIDVLDDSDSSQNPEIPGAINEEFLKHIHNGDIDAVRNDINNGADVNYENDVPIVAAAENNNFEIIKLLVNNGADVNKRNYHCALNVSVAHNINYEITEFLLENGANASGRMHSASLLSHACYNTKQENEEYVNYPISDEQYKIVEILLKNGASPEGKRGDCPASPIVTPILANDYRTIEILLHHGAKLTTMPVLAAANYCAHMGNLKMLNFLLDKGWKPNPKKSKDKRPASPLHYAIVNGFVDIVRLLIDKKIDLNYVPNYRPDSLVEIQFFYDIHPLSLAIKFDKMEILQLLLENGSNPDGDIEKITNCRDLPPLIHAVNIKNFEAIKILSMFTDINQLFDFPIDSFGYPDGFYSARYGERGTVLDLAESVNDKELIAALLECGAKNSS